MKNLLWAPACGSPFYFVPQLLALGESQNLNL